MNGERFRLAEISVRGLCMDLLKNAWMILLAAAAAWLAATGWHNLAYQPEYTSSATLVVTMKDSTSTYSSLSLTTQMADVFSQVFQSDTLAEKIAEETGEKISGRISCRPISETNLLVLSVTCRHPRQSYLFINAALEHYEEVAGNIFSNASLQTVQEPEVPDSPSNTSLAMRYRYPLMAVAAAGMALLIGLLYVTRFTVKNLLSAQHQLDGKIRGVIPYEEKGIAMRRRKKSKEALLLTSPVVSMDFAEAERRTAVKVESHMRRHGQKILLVSSIMENEGKSTVAANLALALAEKHKKVLLVDGDLRKPAQYKVFEQSGKNRISFDQVLAGESSWKEAARCSDRDRIWELFQFRQIPNPDRALRQERLAELADAWKTQMDYIIIDCSPVAVSADVEVWASVADSVLLVVREDWAVVRAINDAVDMISQNGTDFAGFVLNAFYKEWSRSERTQEYSYSRYGGYAAENHYGRDYYGSDVDYNGKNASMRERGQDYAGPEK